MPTYDYKCEACGHAFEHWQPISKGKLRTCPKCGKKKLVRLIGAGAGLIFKGTGFYETDYKRKSGGDPKGGESKGGESKGGELKGGDTKGGESTKAEGSSAKGESAAKAPESKPSSAPAPAPKKSSGKPAKP